MTCIRTILITIALSLAVVAPASAQYLQKGYEAIARGDFATALRHFRPLAERGDAMAQKSLGIMYFRGDGIPKDDTEAVRWFRLSAEQGNAVAQSNLGSMYEKGRGVPKDETEAVRLFRLAAEQGLAAAQNNLGLMYDTGRGVPEDLVSAYMWWNLASAQGNYMAKKNKEIVVEQMTREQIAEAQRLSRECLARNYKGC